MSLLDLVKRIEKQRRELDGIDLDQVRDMDLSDATDEEGEQITVYTEIVSWADIAEELPVGSEEAFHQLQERLLHPYDVAYMAAVCEFFPGKKAEALTRMAELLPTHGTWIEGFDARRYFKIQRQLYYRRERQDTEHSLVALNNDMPNAHLRYSRRKGSARGELPQMVHRGRPVHHL